MMYIRFDGPQFRSMGENCSVYCKNLSDGKIVKFQHCVPAISKANVTMGFLPNLFSTQGCKSTIGIKPKVGKTKTK